MRDNKVLEVFIKHTKKKLKEMNIFKFLKKEIEVGTNSIQQYVIKKGINKDKIAKWRQHNTILIGILGTILLGLSSWVLMTIVELKVHLGMLSEEIMYIDKQIGRIYNHMDRLTK